MKNVDQGGDHDPDRLEDAAVLADPVADAVQAPEQRLVVVVGQRPQAAEQDVRDHRRDAEDADERPASRIARRAGRGPAG